MRIWTFIKLLAALVVMGVIAFTAMLTYHIVVEPLGGIFEKVVPSSTDVVIRSGADDLSKMLDSSNMPDIEPGEVVYQKAIELIAMGDLSQAREKLRTVVNIYPSSPSAPDARRIVGEMNLDEVLSPDFKEGKSTYLVKRGDSYLKIAERTNCPLDCIMMLNGLTDFGGLQPGDELVVMPLDFRIIIDLPKNSLSLWRAGKFLKDYEIVHIQTPSNMARQTTQIASKAGYLGGKKVLPSSKNYRQAEKILQLAKINLQIRAFQPSEDDDSPLPRGIYLKPYDMEELSLLTRTGNEVEIRTSSR